MATNLADVRAGAMAGMQDSPLAPFLNKGYTPNFDPDAFHAMQERDNQLIRDEIMHGFASRAFIYSFEISGKRVNGISVIGARELASQYRGIKARIVATVEKRGPLFIFRSFTPLNIETRVLHDLSDDEDYYECVMEVSDIKTGNSIEVRKKENKNERRRDGTPYARPHYDVICESKAYRNGVLSILPQNVIKDFEAKCLATGDKSAEMTLDQLRAGAIAFAAKNAIALDRKAVNGLAYAEINGLGSAAKQSKEAFMDAALALGLIESTPETGNATKKPDAPKETTKPAAKAAPAKAAEPQGTATTDGESIGTTHTGQRWEPSPEEQEAIRLQEAAEAAQSAPARTRRSRGDAGGME